MTKKEILEIRKLLKAEDPHIDRICGCYVDGHKEKILEMKEAFLSLPDEEMHKYSDIFRKALSGQPGKNLLDLEFPLTEEKDGGKQQKLLKLRDSALKDNDLCDAFYSAIISSYLYADNYLILLAHGFYDVPGRTSDGLELDDASDYVYDFIICAICPVALSKAGLVYDSQSNSFIDKVQDWMVQMPEAGFLFPAFNDRASDIHSALYYTKNPELYHPEITEDILGCEAPLTAGTQKEVFDDIIEDTFSDKCTFDVAKTVHENLNSLIEEQKNDPDAGPIGKKDLRRFLSSCGADDEQLSALEASYDEHAGGDKELMPSNIADRRRFEVKSDDIKIQIASGRTNLIETKIIDGTEYIIIPLTDEVTVNGIRVRSSLSRKTSR